MLFEWRTYQFAPGKAAAYLEAFRAEGLPLVTRHLPMLGYWLTEAGRLNVLHHLWVYEDLDDRAARRTRLAADADWTAGFGLRAFPMIERQETFLLGLAAAAPALDAAVAGARAVIPAPPPGAPLLADRWAVYEHAAPGQPAPRAAPDGLVGEWEVLLGDRPGSRITLSHPSRPLPAPGGGPVARRELTRPCGFSPLR